MKKNEDANRRGCFPLEFFVPMDSVRIAVLLGPFLDVPSSAANLDQISMYVDLLQRWNARVNLTTVRNQEEIVTRHFGEL